MKGVRPPACWLRAAVRSAYAQTHASRALQGFKPVQGQREEEAEEPANQGGGHVFAQLCVAAARTAHGWMQLW